MRRHYGWHHANSAAERAQASGRYVLNQIPQTTERYFGRYWTRLTRTENGVTRVNLRSVRFLSEAALIASGRVF